MNGNVGDESSNDVAVMSNGVAPNESNHATAGLGLSQVPGDFNDGVIRTARVRYVQNIMSIYIDDLDNPILSVAVDLDVLLALEGMPATTDEEAGWQSYVLTMAERYRGKVVGYVLGRAEGDAPSQIETYAFLLKLAAIQIRTVDRRAVLLTGDGRSHEPQWIDSLYGQDVAPYFDGIAVTADDDLGAVIETVARQDPSAQVIVTGAPLDGSPGDIARRVLVEIVSKTALKVTRRAK